MEKFHGALKSQGVVIARDTVHELLAHLEGGEELIQVCADASDPAVSERELRALAGAEQPAGLPPAAGAAAATQPASQPSSEQVLRELLSKREANPLIEPVRRPPLDAVSGLSGPVDPMLAGVAPGAENPGPLSDAGQLEI